MPNSGLRASVRQTAGDGNDAHIDSVASVPGSGVARRPLRMAIGLEESARGPSGVRILLISKSQSGLHIVCIFGGQAPFRKSFLDSNGREKNPLSHTWTGAYNGRRVKHDKPQVPGWNPRPSRARDATSIKVATCDKTRVAIYGGGGNCTRGLDSVSICPQCRYDTTSAGCPGHGREDEALRQLVTNWHHLTPAVRDAIMKLVLSHQAFQNHHQRYYA